MSTRKTALITGANKGIGREIFGGPRSCMEGERVSPADEVAHLSSV